MVAWLGRETRGRDLRELEDSTQPDSAAVLEQNQAGQAQEGQEAHEVR